MKNLATNFCDLTYLYSAGWKVKQLHQVVEHFNYKHDYKIDKVMALNGDWYAITLKPNLKATTYRTHFCNLENDGFGCGHGEDCQHDGKPEPGTAPISNIILDVNTVTGEMVANFNGMRNHRTFKGGLNVNPFISKIATGIQAHIKSNERLNHCNQLMSEMRADWDNNNMEVA
jgi:hypothetical protein